MNILRGTQSHHFLFIDILLNQSVTILALSENQAHYQQLLLKQGVKINECKIQIIDLFSQNLSSQQEELPLTETTPKYFTGSQEYQKELTKFILQQIKNEIVIIDDLFYLFIMCQERKEELTELIRQLQKKELHIYAPFIGYEPYERICKFLDKYAKSVTILQENKSGYSKDIDGSIIREDRKLDQFKITKQIYVLETSNIKYLSALQIV